MVPLVMWVGPPLAPGGDPVVYRLNKEANPWQYDYIAPHELPGVILELKARGVRPLMYDVTCKMCDATCDINDTNKHGWYNTHTPEGESLWFDKIGCLRIWSAEELMRKRA